MDRVDRINRRGHDRQGGQEGSRWTGRTRGIMMDRADKEARDGKGGHGG